MIEFKNHVGELHCSLFPYYALTNWVAALRAYQLDEINIIIRLWMVVGLIGGAHGHFMDLYQVLKVYSFHFLGTREIIGLDIMAYLDPASNCGSLTTKVGC